MTTETRRRWFALWVLFGINTMNFYDRMILSVVAEPIRKEWTLSDSALGLLGTAFTLLYAFVGVPFGRLADTRPRKWILSAGCALWSVLTAASGLAQSFWMLFTTRLGVGVGEASCSPAANSLIGDLFPPKQRSRALSLFMLGLPVGMFLSFFISGRVAHAYGWRTAFLVALLPGLALAALALWLPEPARGSSEGRVESARRPGSPYLVLLGIPTLLWIIISGALHNFNMLAATSFMTAFLTRYHSLDLKTAAFAASVIFGVSGVVGLLAGGWAADRFGGKRTDGRLLLSAMTLALAAPCIYLALRQPAGAVVPFVLLAGTGLAFVYVYYSSVYAAIQDVVEPSLRGTAMALYFFAMYVLGGSLGPLGTGMLSDHFAKQAMRDAGATSMTESFKAIGLHGAMHAIPVLCLVLAVVLYAASRTVGRDMTRLRAWQDSRPAQTGTGGA
ncbi:MAG: MFS transporter [Pedosphaera sp.]|nr:MFS transporter [Pedosphaera sp.]